MDSQDTEASIKFKAKLVERTIDGNYFANIPDDLKSFLHHYDGTMKGIIENLYPGMYEIEIKIKSVE